MSEPLIFICRKGSITQPSKVELRKAGVIVVEADQPGDCKLMRASAEIEQSAMLSAALSALVSQPAAKINGGVTSIGRAQEKFTHLMAELMNAASKKAADQHKDGGANV